MTPKEKAEELIDKFYSKVEVLDIIDSRRCALTVVNEILEIASWSRYMVGRNNLSDQQFWQEVKQEIEKLKNK